MTKKQLRRQYLAKRNAMTDSQARSEKIYASLLLGGADTWKRVLCYLSFGNEVDTRPIIRQLLEWGTMVCVPVCDPDTCTITAAEIHNLSNCKKNRYGILEPVEIIPYTGTFDAILVPGVVFSRTGHRIGFGKGYYDRFLALANEKTCKIGLCYDWQLANDIPYEPHDIKMDQIITDERVLHL